MKGKKTRNRLIRIKINKFDKKIVCFIKKLLLIMHTDVLFCSVFKNIYILGFRSCLLKTSVNTKITDSLARCLILAV